MKKILLLIGIATTICFLSACGTDDSSAQKEEVEKEDSTVNSDTQQEGEKIMYPQLSKEIASNEALVTMNTSMGPIKIKLFPELAPKTVENFLTHAENGYYDGMIFHRIIQDFMIQGGDPTGTGMGGESIYGAEFEDEFSMNLFNLRGALSMANAGPNTNGSQFFIVQASEPPATAQQMIDGGWPKEIAEAYEKMGGTPHLDQKHTVFGQVIEGLDIVDQMAAVETDANDKPVVDITIDSIEVVQK
ncbi:peptidyl-prolyl cis-trans isomerase B (cyclophilin B) [Paenisporosarcina quisquiliarum]|uniref:peptidylprolyl isomerase n=1 Tax=Psychrobacillus psychrodurans TaxID=126157 RepID=UPI0008D83AD0|nr:peptidyl-prolyl cis-trans isomerase B (cyclophilin B) [Paenisporosarcina quisquiliarum]